MSQASQYFFHNGPSYRRAFPQVGLLDYTGGAAILSRERPGAFLAPSHPPLISSSTYRLALPLRGRSRRGRSRTFTGQCCQPFCPGDPTGHSDGPPTVTKYRPVRERNQFPRLRQVTELSLPPEPKRDTSRTVFTWPLRRRSLPPGAGCVPSSRGSSEDFRTGLDPHG
jgi:hypothetical protein